jgi:hypothetical protein
MTGTESFENGLRTYLDERTQRAGDPAAVERVMAAAIEQPARFRHRNLFLAVGVAGAAALVVATPLTVHLLSQGQHTAPAPTTRHTPVPSPRTTPAPSAPVSSAGFAVADDPATGQVVLFGGRFDYDNTWIWNGVHWSLAHPALSPPGRAFASEAYDPLTKQVLLFGGTAVPVPPTTQCCFVGTALNDTWAWNGSTWHEVEGGSSEAPVDGFMGWDNAGNEMVLVSASSPNPPPTLANGNSVPTPLSTWVWSGTQWVRQPHASGGALGPIAYDPVSHSLLNVGYQQDSNSLATSTYRWNGTTWTKLDGSRGSFNPPVGAGLTPSIALDPATGRLVFLSPSYSDGPAAKAWMWNGEVWTSVPLSQWPGWAETLVTDSSHDRLLLLGSDKLQNSTAVHVWTVSGSAWKQLDVDG